jgi:hypothetical protein
MLMPYGQYRGKKSVSIDINALRAKEKTKFKQFLNFIFEKRGMKLFTTSSPFLSFYAVRSTRLLGNYLLVK